MEKVRRHYPDVLKGFAEQKENIHRLWNVGQETADLLAFLVLLTKPKIALELGTSNGFSTFHLAFNKTTKVITVDSETARNTLAKENLKGFDNIEFITDRIEQYIASIDYQIDFLFIDANKTSYLKYLNLLESHFASTAIIVADNIDSHGNTSDYREYVSSSGKYFTIHLGIDDGLLISGWGFPVLG